MTNKEKYRRAFGVLHASEDILTEVTHMETKKHFSLRKAVLLCAAVIAAFAIKGFTAIKRAALPDSARKLRRESFFMVIDLLK